MIIECVPNISEGRDYDVIEEIASCVKNVEIKNIHIDPDHNRTVFTFFGGKNEIVEAAFSLSQRALELLDINEHKGEHPFIGVVDVVPFVPILGATMADAVDCSRALGERLWNELKVPVYFYGEAAIIKERKELPYVRHGGFSALKKEIGDKKRKPDIGEGLNQWGGATAVGAREVLIAFNVNLKTNDLDAARSIAKNIREKSGGLPGVRAFGLYLESRQLAQVSVNIVDHKKTSIKELFYQVERWAAEYNVEILESELVGMIPKEAYEPNLEKELKISNFSRSLIF